MVQLGILHYTYLFMIFSIILLLCLRKEVVLPCIIGIGVLGYVATGSFLEALQIIYRAVVVSGKEFIEIIIIISLVNAMSKALQDMGADELMIYPIKKWMGNQSPVLAFFIVGITMLITSWFIWPSPAVAFIGAIVVPAAIKIGLPPIWVAVALNLFGSGVALSSDYFIQAAPSITAKTAGIQDPFIIVKASFSLWLIMSSVTILTAFFFMKKELIRNKTIHFASGDHVIKLDSTLGTRFVAVGTPTLFLIDIFLMYRFKLKGGDATALIGGSAVLIMVVVSIIQYKIKRALNEVTGYIKDGFTFSMKVFSPIIIIGAFFFIGSKETAEEILGTGASGLLADIGMEIASHVPLSKASVILMQSSISGILGVGGSGFSGLPLIGTLAQTFSSAILIHKEDLAALGQIITIWIGGGTIIPWSVAPIAAICEVSPFDLVRKNIVPVAVGIGATILAAMVLF